MDLATLLFVCLPSHVPGAGPVLAPDEVESKAIAVFERALQDPKTGAAGVEAALEDLRLFDSPAVAEALVKGFTQLEVSAQQIDKQAHDDIEKGKLSPGEIASRRKNVDPIRKAQAAILARVGRTRNADALVFLVDRLLGDDRAAMSLKVEAVNAAVQAGEAIVQPLSRALQRAKKQDDLVAVMMAAQKLEKLARPLAPRIVALVDHADPTVREYAALALAKLAVPEGIEPLVRRMDKEAGRTQLKIAAALEILTRQKLGLSAAAWKSWFAAEGIRYTSGQAELGGGEAAVTEQASGYFHGIPQDNRSIIYVIDVSGSMVVSLTNPRFEGVPPQLRPIPAPPGEESRMDCSRRELIKALGDLPPGTKFDIVHFSTKAERYAPRMIEASPAVIKKAQKWVEELEPEGATNIYDAMESAFGLAGRGSADKYYDSTVDTIFLLTDGQPTIGPYDDSTERIEEAVRRMNPFKRVIVHAIGLGEGIDRGFLERLARENGGVFVQR
jgi:hypothetical protein